jgi:hypothetical protein
MGVMDYFFLFDTKESRANILGNQYPNNLFIGCYVYDKFDFDKVKEHFKRKAF